MTTTPELIAALAANVTPVRRLRPPLVRASGWLLLAAVVLLLIGMGHGFRPNLAERLGDWPFRLGLLGALLTGICAAVAAFFLSLPGRSRWWLALPIAPMVLWLATIGHQCLTNWVSPVPGLVDPGETAECLATVGLASLPLSLAMMMMLRHAAPLRPANVVFTGCLAVAAITATALTLFHPIDATVEILVFNLGTAMVIIGGGSLIGALAWR